MHVFLALEESTVKQQVNRYTKGGRQNSCVRKNVLQLSKMDSNKANIRVLTCHDSNKAARKDYIKMSMT